MAEGTQAPNLHLYRMTWPRMLRFVRSMVHSAAGRKGLTLAAVLLTLMLGMNGLNVVNSYVARDFMTAIADRRMNDFVAMAFLYLGVFGVSTVVASILRFCEERLGLLWREWLTMRLVGLYFEHATYYRLSDGRSVDGEIENPDQRIADDVRTFTTTTISFVLMFLNGTFTALAFSGVMWSISPQLFGIAVAYAIVGSVLTYLLGRPLIGLNYAQFDKEAAFRADLIHVREHAESVAVLGYEGPLHTQVGQRLAALIDNMRRIISINRNLAFFTNGYNYLIQIIPALIVAPLYMRGEVEFGVIPQSAMAFSQLVGAFSLIVTQFQSLSSFAAVAARLNSLSEALERADATARASMEMCRHNRRTRECTICLQHPPHVLAAPAMTVREQNECVAYEGLTLRSLHEGRLLVDRLSVTIPIGLRTMITGPNETAKVALFRATAGIWGAREGLIVRPEAGRILFVPEKPYLPPTTLRELLVGARHSRSVNDEAVEQALQACGLEGVSRRAGGLDAARDWRAVLSLSEQQLLVCARLLVLVPEFAFLDRITTVLNPEQVDRVLRLLGERSITYIVGCEDGAAIEPYDAILEIRMDGGWSWRPH